MNTIDFQNNLAELISMSGTYFKTKNKRRPNVSEYFTKIWLARSANKDNARRYLPTKKDVTAAFVHHLHPFMLLDGQLFKFVRVEDGDYNNEHAIVTPQAITLLYLLEKDAPETISEELLVSLVSEATSSTTNLMVSQTLARMQEPLKDSKKLSQKSALMGLFLLATGAVSPDSALNLMEDERKEIEYQSDIVEYLDTITKMVYPISYPAITHKFTIGDFSNFIRRNKEMRDVYGDAFQKGERQMFLAVRDENEDLCRKSLMRILRITIEALQARAMDDENIEANVGEVISLYAMGSPMKQSLRRVLFGGQPSFEYYIFLQNLIRDYCDGEDSEFVQ